jgi:hypothetical protein
MEKKKELVGVQQVVIGKSYYSENVKLNIWNYTASVTYAKMIKIFLI